MTNANNIGSFAGGQVVSGPSLKVKLLSVEVSNFFNHKNFINFLNIFPSIKKNRIWLKKHKKT